MRKTRVIIIGAAGRDFHNFNVFFRDNSSFEVVAFTAAQIPDIAGRKYPAELAGSLYPDGIPIYDENDLPSLIKDLKVDLCVFAYSDVSYQHVMRLAAITNASGASFMLLGPNDTMLKSSKPVIAIGATRTGCGKSQTSRRVIEILMKKGLRVVAVRHPMPYGDLVAQRVQRFATLEDFQKNNCTIEEMEEFEPHIRRGNVIYAGVDYEAILRAAENDPLGCDVIVWDGGNNDFPFFKPDLMIGVADPLRPGAEVNYYPGEIVARLAHVIVINKIDSASLENINIVRENILKINPNATVIEAASPIKIENPSHIKGKKVLVIEDGPTLTHGEMKIGAGIVAAMKYGAAEIIDPRPYLVGRLIETFKTYPNIGTLLPAMGYGQQQMKDLEATINSTPCDTVIIATPIDLNRIIKINKPTVRVEYELQEIGHPTMEDVLNEFMIKVKTNQFQKATV
ncbi:MAG: cyclic 2,3-diphosphoglycerate synthase [Bacteroidales bacterium]|nr:cyclic 2,3-diphosphoglycerate synthase [Bacteroidales bacterium]